MKIVTILGARPQFIKAGSVSRAIEEYNGKVESGKLEDESIEEVIIHTGQHFDENMSGIFFDEMKIPKPDYNLDINGLGHGAMTGQMLEKIEEVLLKEKPDWVMVYGDTNSTLAGALAASKLHIKVAHIEAGLRSFNMKMPEEVNRILTDRVSDILFCPTDTAVRNLEKESFPFVTANGKQKIVKSGDVMHDGAIFYKQYARQPKITKNQKPKTKNYILCTIHRAENTDDPQRLKAIFEALIEIAKETPIILPMHPRTRKIVSGFWSMVSGVEDGIYHIASKNQKPKTKNLIIIDPVGYLEMIWLIDNCSLVMTDSGGLQKEAFFFEKTCITLRDETEWVELVENGFNTLAGADHGQILSLYKGSVLQNDFNRNLYGNGQAGQRIVEELLRY